MQVLSNSAQAATAIIGTGLLDALKGLGEDSSVDNLAQKMQDTAVYTADVIRGIGVLIEKLKGLGGLDWGYALEMGNKFSILGLLNKLAPESTASSSGTSAQGLTDLARLQSKFAVQTLAAKKKIAVEDSKALKAAKLKLALEKANLALLKGEEVFDIDKIQIAAALTNQAEQLGKATSASQVLQIANDVARLNVKKSILALEDAIAAKDEAAITAATAKLNADLKVLGTLGAQNLKLLDIKSLLESLKPKDLINLSNLEAALALLSKINLASTGTTKIPTTTTGATTSTAAATAAAVAAVMAKPTLTNTPFAEGGLFNLEDVARSSLLAGLSGGAGVAGAVSGSRYAAQAANQYNITVQAGIGDPNAIAEAIDEVLRSAQQRGTLVGGVFAV
jgi:hypothetical protein